MIEAKGNILTGYAAVWDSASNVLTEKGKTFTEFVRRGAFTRSLANPPRGDVVALWHHGSGRPPLGRTSAGTLKLYEDDVGLRFEIAAPDSAADVVESVRRGDLKGVSFGADIAPKGERWAIRNGKYVRELIDLELYEISIVISAAYPETSVVVRHRQHVEPPEIPPSNVARRQQRRRAIELAR